MPTTDPRCRVSNAKALGVLVRSIVVEREPIYRAQETVHGFATGLFGVAGGNPETTQIYLHADMQLNEQALACVAPSGISPGRYRPDEALLAFLDGL